MFFGKEGIQHGWEMSANLLSQRVDALHQNQAGFLNTAEAVFSTMRSNDCLFAPAGDDKWYCITANKGTGLRLFILDKKEYPGYYIEQVAIEHFILNFDQAGKLSKITQFDVVKMRRENISGYQSSCEILSLDLSKDPQALLGRSVLMDKIQQYFNSVMPVAA